MSASRTEAAHPQAKGLQALLPETALAHLLDAQIAAARTVRAALPALKDAAARAATALRGGHRMAYAGAGSSGLMALSDALELAGTFGIAPDRAPMLFAGGADALLHMVGRVEDDTALAAADLDRAGIGPGDVVICVSASGRTPYTLHIADQAIARGADVVGIANSAQSPLLTIATNAILLDTGPEIVAGSTRMGAGTAQKIALNMLSTLVGLHLGHIHDGLMVNLFADNAKLRERAKRIVCELSGGDEAMAGAALDAADWAVKPAILIAAGARDADHANALLARGEGRLGPALALLQVKQQPPA